MEESSQTVVGDASPQPKKAARRKKPARDRVSSFRCTAADLDLCKRKAKAQGMSLSAYANMAMLNRRDRRPCVPEINKQAHALLGHGVGCLNQIATRVNRIAAEEHRPAKEVLTEIIGPNAERWLTEIAEHREEIKRLRLALVGIGLQDQDRTLRALNEADQMQSEVTAMEVGTAEQRLEESL